jgi:antitoxin ParD1/3/4
MNISLPETLKNFVDERVANAGYGTSSEYLRELIRHDQDRLLLRSMVLDGATSPISGAASAEYFADLRTKTSNRLA